jgi:hypothetical protein
MTKSFVLPVSINEGVTLKHYLNVALKSGFFESLNRLNVSLGINIQLQRYYVTIGKKAYPILIKIFV